MAYEYDHKRCFGTAYKKIEHILYELYELQHIDCPEAKLVVHFPTIKNIEEQMQALRRTYKDSK